MLAQCRARCCLSRPHVLNLVPGSLVRFVDGIFLPVGTYGSFPGVAGIGTQKLSTAGLTLQTTSKAKFHP